MEVKLYVGNLAYTTTETDLRVLFAQAGSINSIDLIMDRDTGQSKGFAFVTMSTQAEAVKAIGMFNAFTMQERELKVNTAKAREERGPGGFQSKLGAFGAGHAATPHKHRPRGGNRRY
jgi:RNA recognition motif-containing protein